MLRENTPTILIMMIIIINKLFFDGCEMTSVVFEKLLKIFWRSKIKKIFQRERLREYLQSAALIYLHLLVVGKESLQILVDGRSFWYRSLMNIEVFEDLWTYSIREYGLCNSDDGPYMTTTSSAKLETKICLLLAIFRRQINICIDYIFVCRRKCNWSFVERSQALCWTITIIILTHLCQLKNELSHEEVSRMFYFIII